MALRQKLSKRRFFDIRTNTNAPSPPTTPNAANSIFHRQLLTSPDSAAKTFLQRYLHKKSANQSAIRLPQFLSIPVGQKLRENMWPVNIAGGESIRLDGLSPPEAGGRISAEDARKILRSAQLEKIREKLRNIPANSIAYSQFVRICSDVCSDSEHGLSCAKMLDDAGNVIILGGIVFLRTHQVTKLMENLISQSVATPNDPRKSELEQMEKQRALIDQKAESLVRAELYCGLGFMVLQTLGFMRLTFWELSWDVMEPICFFVTSIHFALAYGFFLRTSREPTFEGFFQRRFKVKQQKLMKACNFDANKYNQLCRAFYPNYINYGNFGHFSSF